MGFAYQTIRRELHQIPEAGFNEFKTQNYILSKLKELPQDRLEITTWQTGILVKIPGTAGEKTIGYRTDMDGLPIQEATGLAFSSDHPGYMHACGHDFHMTIALMLIEALTTGARLKQHVLVVFQPAEEGPGGAEPLIRSPEFKALWPDEIYALHIAPEYPAGQIAYKEGLLFANTSELFIDFYGKGGHAAYPHLSTDMVVAASYFVTQLQTVISRAVDPVNSGVVTIGKISGGEKQNIIASNARLEGTMRALSPESMAAMKEKVEKHIESIKLAFDCDAAVDYGANYYQVYNDPALTRAFKSYTDRMDADYIICPEAMTGEDFGYFLKEIPGFMFWLGVGSESGLHTSTLNPKEAAIPTAVRILEGYLKERAT